MNKNQYWQNFELGKELDISGTFLYNGIKTLHDVPTLHYESEVFEILYSLSVGLERLLKIVVILIEEDGSNHKSLSESLITHDHYGLLLRVRKTHELNLSKQHKEFVSLLSKFYKSYRYDRYGIETVDDLAKEKRDFQAYVSKYLNIESSDDTLMSPFVNSRRIKKFVGKVVGKISSDLYSIVQIEARAKNLYTYELRYFSKAYKVFMSKVLDFEKEDIWTAEMLIYIASNLEKEGVLGFLNAFPALEFDPGMAEDYIVGIFQTGKRVEFSDELDSLYESVENPGKRLQLIELLVGNGYIVDWGGATDDLDG